MARKSRELEQEFINNTAEKTGRTLEAWMPIIEASGETKPNAILKWLKTNHDLNHMQANFLSSIYLNDGKPVHDYDVLFAKLFDGKEDLKPTYDALESTVNDTFTADEDVVLIPTKTYISIEGEKIFACATLKSKAIRIGLDLGDHPNDDYVQEAKGLGAMPNLSHMIEISSPDDVNATLTGYLRQAYDRVHG